MEILKRFYTELNTEDVKEAVFAKFCFDAEIYEGITGDTKERGTCSLTPMPLVDLNPQIHK
jgi:hypothetical protein